MPKTPKIEQSLPFNPRDQITGFSLSFTKKLIKILGGGLDNDCVFEIGGASANPTFYTRVNNEYAPVINLLAMQIQSEFFRVSSDCCADYQTIIQLYEAAQKFVYFLENE